MGAEKTKIVSKLRILLSELKKNIFLYSSGSLSGWQWLIVATQFKSFSSHMHSPANDVFCIVHSGSKCFIFIVDIYGAV